MARIRSIKPEFWSSEPVVALSRDARLLFIGMWNFADDNGVHPASTVTLKAEVLPLDDLTSDQVMMLVDQMIDQELVEEYEAGGKCYWRIIDWHQEQRIDRPTYRHPTGPSPQGDPDDGAAEGDAGDTTGDTGDTSGARVTCVTGRTYRRLAGKQRQLVLKKLRERDGDTCHRCDETGGLTIFSLLASGDENPNEINSLKLICPACKRKAKRGDTQKFDEGSTSNRRGIDGDSSVTRRRSGSGVEGIGKESSSGSSTTTSSDDVSPRVSPAAIPSDATSDLDALWGAPPAGDVTEPERAVVDPGQELAIEIAVHLRKQKVGVTAMHPAVLDWAARRVPLAVLDSAVRTARDRLGQAASIQGNYLVPIVNEILAGSATGGSGRAQRFDPVAHVNRNRRSA